MNLFFRLLLGGILTFTLTRPLTAAWSPQYYMTPQYSGAYGKPSLAFDNNGVLHMIHMAEIASGNPILVHRKLDGTVWSSPVDLPGPNRKEPGCDLAIDSNNNLHVVGLYRPADDTAYAIFYWRFDGVSWTGPEPVSDTSKETSAPAIAVDRNNDVHITWAQDKMTGNKGDILYRKKQSGAWQPIINITANGSPNTYGSADPDIAADRAPGNRVHIVFHDEFSGDARTYYTNSSNFGNPGSWLPSAAWVQLSSNDYGKAVAIFLDRNNNPNCFWYDSFNTSVKNWAYRRFDGVSWLAAINLGSETPFHFDFDTNNLMHYIYTAQSSGTFELFYKTYNFSAFSSAVAIAPGGGTYKTDFASIATKGASAYVGWEERVEDSGKSGVYFTTNAVLPAPNPVTGLSVLTSDSTNRLSWTNPLSFSLTATRIVYRTNGFPSGPMDGTLVTEVVSVPATAGSFIHTGLTNGQPYYYSAFAKDYTGQYSVAANLLAVPNATSVGSVRNQPNNTIVDLYGVVVTANFNSEGCIYVAEQDRASGIRVIHSNAALVPGDLVNVVGGKVGTRMISGKAAEREITLATVVKAGSSTSPEPLGMNNITLGGASISPLVPGVKDGVGLNNIGSLVRTWGKVTAKSGTSLWIDDGAEIPDTSGRIGVFVRFPSGAIVPANVGDFVEVTGILTGSVPTGWDLNRRQVQARSLADLVILD